MTTAGKAREFWGVAEVAQGTLPQPRDSKTGESTHHSHSARGYQELAFRKKDEDSTELAGKGPLPLEFPIPSCTFFVIGWTLLL